MTGCAQAEENWTDEEIVNAIRKAEGTWTYGIKSVKCETEKECQKIEIVKPLNTNFSLSLRLTP